MTSYIAIIHKEAGSDFGISFSDFPGCVTAGSTLAKARIMAAEALALHLEGMIEEGKAISPPSPLDSIMADPDYQDRVALLVVAHPRLRFSCGHPR